MIAEIWTDRFATLVSTGEKFEAGYRLWQLWRAADGEVGCAAQAQDAQM